MSRPPNLNRAAVHILDSAFSVASGHGEYGLANAIEVLRCRLKDEGVVSDQLEMFPSDTITYQQAADEIRAQSRERGDLDERTVEALAKQLERVGRGHSRPSFAENSKSVQRRMERSE